jgi:aspartate-semialdehyde dehydrogenase
VKIAVVGVTGVVGEMILRVLDERKVAVDELGAFASRDRAEPLPWRGNAWDIRAATPEALRDGRFDAVFFASSDDASEALTAHALAGGAVVIDNSAARSTRTRSATNTPCFPLRTARRSCCALPSHRSHGSPDCAPCAWRRTRP